MWFIIKLSQVIIISHWYVDLEFIYFICTCWLSKDSFGPQKLRLNFKKCNKKNEDFWYIVNSFSLKFTNMFPNYIERLDSSFMLKIQILFITFLYNFFSCTLQINLFTTLFYETSLQIILSLFYLFGILIFYRISMNDRYDIYLKILSHARRLSEFHEEVCLWFFDLKLDHALKSLSKIL